MEDVRRILVPVDFSECSAAALEYAIALARPLHAALEVVHVWVAPSYVSPALAVQVAKTHDMITLETLARRDAADRMRAMLDHSRHDGVEIATRILSGDPLQVITEVAEDCDLIVAGTHGRSGISHLMLGSVAEKIVRRSERPALIVRCPNAAGHEELRVRKIAKLEHGESPVHRIVAAVDFSSCSRVALEHAVVLARTLGASLDIFHAVTHVPVDGGELFVSGYSQESTTPFKEWAKKRAEEEMNTLIALVPGAEKAEIVMAVGDPSHAIVDATKRADYDLVVIGTHGRGGFSRLLLGSIAERVMRRASCPVLCVREARA